jgi:hypothetical protein
VPLPIEPEPVVPLPIVEPEPVVPLPIVEPEPVVPLPDVEPVVPLPVVEPVVPEPVVPLPIVEPEPVVPVAPPLVVPVPVFVPLVPWPDWPEAPVEPALPVPDDCAIARPAAAARVAAAATEVIFVANFMMILSLRGPKAGRLHCWGPGPATVERTSATRVPANQGRVAGKDAGRGMPRFFITSRMRSG